MPAILLTGFYTPVLVIAQKLNNLHGPYRGSFATITYQQQILPYFWYLPPPSY